MSEKISFEEAGLASLFLVEHLMEALERKGVLDREELRSICQTTSSLLGKGTAEHAALAQKLVERWKQVYG